MKLLLISCSQRKIGNEVLIPAIERYDGPTYRCLRKFRDAHKDKALPNNLRILILSAKYQLIFPETEIVNYDFKMTAERAREIAPNVQKDLQQCLYFYSIAYGGTEEVFINLGKTYMQTLEGFDWACIKTLEASGGIGERTSQMKAWLEG